MARQVTSGLELRDIVSTQTTAPDGVIFGPGTPVVETTIVRSGSASLKCAGTNGTGVKFTLITAITLGTDAFARVYIYVPTGGLPTSSTNQAVLAFGTTTIATAFAIRLETNGTLTLRSWNGTSLAQQGSASSAITLDAWNRIELRGNTGTGSIDQCEGRLNGVSFASASGLSITDEQILNVLVGNNSSSGTGVGTIIYIDDIAVNDSTGSFQNSFPGEGRVVLAVPASDSAVGTGWTLGTGTAIAANSGSVAVKNTPPVGVADLTAGSDTKQIRNATANANVNYDANLATYSSLGILPDDVITVLDPIISTAAPVTTSAKQGTVGVVSNPAIANIALGAGGTSGAFWAGAAAAAYPTGWKWSHGTITYNPRVTLGTAPVMRVTQVTSSTRIAMVDFMGMYIEYVPAMARRQIRRLAGNMARDWQDF